MINRKEIVPIIRPVARESLPGIAAVQLLFASVAQEYFQNAHLNQEDSLRLDLLGRNKITRMFDARRCYFQNIEALRGLVAGGTTATSGSEQMVGAHKLVTLNGSKRGLKIVGLQLQDSEKVFTTERADYVAALTGRDPQDDEINGFRPQILIGSYIETREPGQFMRVLNEEALWGGISITLGAVACGENLTDGRKDAVPDRTIPSRQLGPRVPTSMLNALRS